MPQIFRVAGYLIYFWSNENEPLEPVHVHCCAIMLLNAIEKATGKTIDGRSSEVVVRDFGGVLV